MGLPTLPVVGAWGWGAAIPDRIIQHLQCERSSDRRKRRPAQSVSSHTDAGPAASRDGQRRLHSTCTAASCPLVAVQLLHQEAVTPDRQPREHPLFCRHDRDVAVLDARCAAAPGCRCAVGRAAAGCRPAVGPGKCSTRRQLGVVRKRTNQQDTPPAPTQQTTPTQRPAPGTGCSPTDLNACAPAATRVPPLPATSLAATRVAPYLQVRQLQALLPGMLSTLQRMKPAELVRMATQLDQVGHRDSAGRA